MSSLSGCRQRNAGSVSRGACRCVIKQGGAARRHTHHVDTFTAAAVTRWPAGAVRRAASAAEGDGIRCYFDLLDAGCPAPAAQLPALCPGNCGDFSRRARHRNAGHSRRRFSLLFCSSRFRRSPANRLPQAHTLRAPLAAQSKTKSKSMSAELGNGLLNGPAVGFGENERYA